MNTFMVCEFCQFQGDDICEFRMWQLGDAQDQPIPDDMHIICQKEPCRKRIDDDPRLFFEVPWSRGGPGKFMLLCGDCTFRDKFACKHPNLKTNGGAGLLVHFTNTIFSGMRICMTDGTSIAPGPPATSCEGNPNPRGRK